MFVCYKCYRILYFNYLLYFISNIDIFKYYIYKYILQLIFKFTKIH